MKKVRINDIYVSSPYSEQSTAFKEGKRTITIELIDDDIVHHFGSRVETKTKKRICEAITRKMIKLPFGLKLFY